MRSSNKALTENSAFRKTRGEYSPLAMLKKVSIPYKSLTTKEILKIN